MPGPIDDLKDLEFSLYSIFNGGNGMRGLFQHFQWISRSRLESAIRRGVIGPIINSPEYKRAIELARKRAEKMALEIAQQAARDALVEIGATTDITGASLRIARRRARVMIDDFDRKSGQNLRRLLRNMGKRYKRKPNKDNLRDLSADLKPHIGLSEKTSKNLTKWQNKTRGKMTYRARANEQKRRWAAQANKRSAVIASHETARIANETRQEMFEHAMDEGLLPRNIRKQVITAQDERVRPLHSQQAMMPPVRLKSRFQIFNQLFPPWNGEYNCRCYHVLVM